MFLEICFRITKMVFTPPATTILWQSVLLFGVLFVQDQLYNYSVGLWIIVSLWLCTTLNYKAVILLHSLCSINLHTNIINIPSTLTPTNRLHRLLWTSQWCEATSCCPVTYHAIGWFSHHLWQQLVGVRTNTATRNTTISMVSESPVAYVYLRVYVCAGVCVWGGVCKRVGKNNIWSAMNLLLCSVLYHPTLQSSLWHTFYSLHVFHLSYHNVTAAVGKVCQLNWNKWNNKESDRRSDSLAFVLFKQTCVY